MHRSDLQEFRVSTASLLVAFTVILSGAASPSAAQQGAVPAHILAAVKDSGRWQRDRERDQRSNPLEILTFMGIRPGEQILDLFTGGGYWAELFARAVGPDGTVTAHTNTAYRNFAGKLLTSRFADNRVAAVSVLDSEINDLGLGNEVFDRIFIGLGYHDLYFYADFWPLPGRDYFFAQLYAALRPGGTVTIIDHAAQPGTAASAAQRLHRIDEAFAKADWQRAGFRYVDSNAALRNPADSRTLDVFDDDIRRKTDRFVLQFEKPAQR